MSDVAKIPTLTECETDIERASEFIRGGFYVVGKRFAEIKKDELWLQADSYSGTFEAYCDDRWPWFSMRHIERLMAAPKVVDNLLVTPDQLVGSYPQDLPQSESVVRALDSIGEEPDDEVVKKNRHVWGETWDRAEHEPKKATAALVKEVKRELYPPIPDTDGDLKVVPVIYHCKAVPLLKKVRAGSTGLILTDPPYISEFHDNYDEYLRFTESWLLSAAEKISETGWLMVFASSEPDEMRVYLDTFAKTDLILKTPFVWTYNNTIGPSGSENLIRNYQIGWLAGREGSTLRGDIKQKWASQTVNAPDGRLGNRYFEWQKPDELADTLVGVLSQDDSVVVDPFAGSGAFLLAAGRRGLKSFGCDSIEDQVSLCEQRGCARG